MIDVTVATFQVTNSQLEEILESRIKEGYTIVSATPHEFSSRYLVKWTVVMTKYREVENG